MLLFRIHPLPRAVLRYQKRKIVSFYFCCLKQNNTAPLLRTLIEKVGRSIGGMLSEKIQFLSFQYMVADQAQKNKQKQKENRIL